MTIESAAMTPSNSLLFVLSREGADVPIAGGPLNSTSTCVSVGTLVEYDGETAVRVMDREASAHTDLAPLAIFDGTITVRGGAVLVGSILDNEFIVWPCADGDVPLRIYTNHPTEPDEIDIVVG